MKNTDPITQALAAALPPDLRSAATALAAPIGALSDDPSADPGLDTPDDTLVAALEALAGQRLVAGGSLLSFNGGAQLGDVSIGDVAGGNVVKFSIPITRQETTTQTVSAGAGSAVTVVKISGSGHTLILGGGNANPAALAPLLAAPPLTDGATVF